MLAGQQAPALRRTLCLQEFALTDPGFSNLVRPFASASTRKQMAA